MNDLKVSCQKLFEIEIRGKQLDEQETKIIKSLKELRAKIELQMTMFSQLEAKLYYEMLSKRKQQLRDRLQEEIKVENQNET